MPVTITNNSGNTINNYPVPIRINTGALISGGYMQPDGRDIRFTNNCGGSLIDYCLEGYMNSDTTKIWVRIASIAPYGSTRIYLYTGNPSASPGGTLSLFEGPYSSTSNVLISNTGSVSNSQRGFHFSPNRDILVTHLGKRVPNSTPRYVTLFDYASHDIIAQLQVSGQGGVYNYSPLQNFLWLQGGHEYILAVYQGAGDDYYFGVSSQIGQYLTYYEMRYRNNCSQDSYPNQSLLNNQFGIPDMLYYVRQTPITPEPSSAEGLLADTNTPAPPANLFAIAGTHQATLKWKKNTEFDVSKYFVYLNTVDNPSAATLVDSTNHPDTVCTVSGLLFGTPYYFWVKAVDRYCSRRVSGFSNVAMIAPLSVSGGTEIPEVFALHQNYPNPFNPVTEIKFDVAEESMVKLVVYDLLGREAAILVNEIKKPGKFSAMWNSEDFPSGIYICKFAAGSYQKTMKMVLLK